MFLCNLAQFGAIWCNVMWPGRKASPTERPKTSPRRGWISGATCYKPTPKAFASQCLQGVSALSGCYRGCYAGATITRRKQKAEIWCRESCFCLYLTFAAARTQSRTGRARQGGIPRWPREVVNPLGFIVRNWILPREPIDFVGRN
jgi:hypothetical protein